MVRKRVYGNKRLSFIVLILVVVILGVVSLNIYYSEDARNYLPEVFSAPGTFSYDSNNITSSYNTGEEIKGNFVISFDEYPGNAVLTSNFENEISLLSFLELNGLSNGFEFNCSTPGCLESYTSISSVSSLDINFAGKVIGFKISGGGISSVDSAKFKVVGNSFPSFSNQLFIDVLNDGEDLLINTRRTIKVNSFKHQGCFDSNAGSFTNADITTSSTCENITLPVAPGYKLGAIVINSTNGKNSELKMELRDIDGGIVLGSCILPTQAEDIEELGCIIDYPVSQVSEFLVCIKEGASNLGEYDIRSETSGENCGADNFGNQIDRDFEVFANTMKFASINLLVDDLFYKDSTGGNLELSDVLKNYVFNNFNGECQEDCIVPIRFFGQTQTLTFSEVEVKYKADGGGTGLTDTNLYEIEIEEPLTTSGDLELDLEMAGFVIPLGSEETTFELYLDGVLVFDEDIEIAESFDFSVSPRFVAFGQDTLFSVNTTENITSSVWRFGDGSSAQTVFGTSVTHIYDDTSENSFEMEITLKNDDDVTSTKTFDIIVGSARDISNKTIDDYYVRISNVSDDLKDLDSWIREDVESEINILSLNSSVKSIQDEFDSSITDSDYQNVMLDLLNLAVPLEVKVFSSGTNVPLVIGIDNMITDYVEELSSKSVEDTSKLKQRIIGWMNSNFDAKTSFEQIAAFYDDGEEVILTKFIMNIDSKQSVEENSNLFLGYGVESNGKFKSNYGHKLISDVNYLPLNSGDVSEVFEFYIIDEITPEDLGAYISPQISELGGIDFTTIGSCNNNNVCEENLGENENSCAADCGDNKRTGFAVIWIIVVIVVGFVVYIILQEWYKRHYENHLFKNSNELYNLINFIYNARKTGLRDRETRKKLKGAGWNSEKIIFAFKKIDGKRTGMFEIPIFKFLENRKVKKELQKRHGGKIDNRIIRRKIIY